MKTEGRFCKTAENIQYELQYKSVKNINLRIKADGTVHVSANIRVAQAVIDEFVISKREFIERAVERAKERALAPRKQYFTEEELKKYITDFCKRVYPYYEKKGVSYTQIKFRNMKSCWGSCNSKGILTFNTRLAFAPPECVKSVVWHEFTHFLVPNHSKEFYAELAKVCPEWKTCRKKLSLK